MSKKLSEKPYDIGIKNIISTTAFFFYCTYIHNMVYLCIIIDLYYKIIYTKAVVMFELAYNNCFKK